MECEDRATYRCSICGSEHEERLMLAHKEGCAFWKSYEALDELASSLGEYDGEDGAVVGGLRNTLWNLMVKVRVF